jgi:hypothetical protein
MTLQFLLTVAGLLFGLLLSFVVGRRLYQNRFDRSRRRPPADEDGDTRKIFAALSNDQQWLVARLVDEGTFAAADWNICLDSVLFVERDEASGKRRIKPEFRDALARLVRERQPDVPKPPADGPLPRGGDFFRSTANAFV